MDLVYLLSPFFKGQEYNSLTLSLYQVDTQSLTAFLVLLRKSEQQRSFQSGAALFPR